MSWISKFTICKIKFTNCVVCVGMCAYLCSVNNVKLKKQ